MSEIAIRSAPAINNMDDLARVSKMLAESGYFRDARDAAQAGVKVLCGLESGFGAFAAMAGVHIIEGKPSIGANLMALAIKRSGKYNYKVTEHTDEVCSVTIYERWDGQWQEVGVSRFTLDDGKKAGIRLKDSKGGPTPWAKYPRNMLFARAISNAVRWYCPDALSVTVYTPEELGATVDGEGNVIDVEVVEHPKPPKAADEPAPSNSPPEPVETPKTGIGEARAGKLRAQLEQMGADTSNEAQLIENALGLSAFSTLAELPQKLALTLHKLVKETAREKEAWETWNSDAEAQGWAAEKSREWRIFNGGHELMNAWESVRDACAKANDGDISNLYKEWFGYVVQRTELAKAA